MMDNSPMIDNSPMSHYSTDNVIKRGMSSNSKLLAGGAMLSLCTLGGMLNIAIVLCVVAIMLIIFVVKSTCGADNHYNLLSNVSSCPNTPNHQHAPLSGIQIR
jgi:hypothetical protein